MSENSYGIILSAIVSDQPQFLLHRRRDTYEYIAFIKGLWTRNDLPTLIARMTKQEKDRILTYTFKELWDDLWVTRDSFVYNDSKTYARGYKKFTSAKNTIIKTIEITLAVPISLWGFPKGKKRLDETEIEGALRELQEETKIQTDLITIISERPLMESYKGSDDITYECFYYVAITDKPHDTPIKLTPQCIRTTCVTEETSKIGWFTLDEAKTLLDLKGLNIIKRANALILNYIH